MVTAGLHVRLRAQPGKEQELERFLRSAVGLVEAEPATIDWFAVRVDASTFAVFDTFPDDAGRRAHLAGRVAEALLARAGELLVEPPDIQAVDVIALKPR
jgi:quinol monooxygenase YgiN